MSRQLGMGIVVLHIVVIFVRGFTNCAFFHGFHCKKGEGHFNREVECYSAHAQQLNELSGSSRM